jgi:trans-aconitate methyltransferase
MRRAVQLDQQWQRKVPENDRRYTPWMPFSTPAFVALLAEAVPEARETRGDIRFLDIGCGPGSKMLIARDLFGLDATGFDRVPEYTAAARSLGLNANDADAEHYVAYGSFSVIWFNRVARDAEIQARIEARVWRDAAPGAVVLCANLEDRPPAAWLPVLDDWEDRRGIWAKPDVPPAPW